MSDPESRPGTDRRHYSYSHYADQAVAEGFHELRFGGPIGRYLLEEQERLLVDAFSPLPGKRILDVGVGTGRAAIGLASRGADVTGVDASPQMLREARTRIGATDLRIELGVADAHHLPFGDRTVDAAMSLRVLMHAIDWRACVAELCRVSRWRVVVDFPALSSVAVLESGARHIGHALGRKTEPYRVIAERDVAAAFTQRGFRVIEVRRQFVLPIAFHKALGRLPLTEATERALSAIGLLRLFGSPVTMVAER